jgi:DNA polymerase-3 subunit gamma/tau
LTLQQVRDAWPEILDNVQKARRSAWTVVFTSQARDLKGDVLTVTFPSQVDVESFKVQGLDSVSEYLRKAILDVLGVRVKFIAKVESAGGSHGGPAAPTAAAATVVPSAEAPHDPYPASEPAVPTEPTAGGWEVAQIPGAKPVAETVVQQAAPSQSVAAPSGSKARPVSAAAAPSVPAAASVPSAPAPNGRQRYGESVVREILGANFIEEQAIVPQSRSEF